VLIRGEKIFFGHGLTRMEHGFFRNGDYWALRGNEKGDPLPDRLD
jgi:hypothetical protein